MVKNADVSNVFEKTALKAVELMKNKDAQNPAEAWDSAIKNFTESCWTRKKGCPKNAFLGLYEKELIAGIHSGSDTHFVENRNKKYAVKAVGILRKNPALANLKANLWKTVLEGVDNPPKSHNGQMDVVIALWNKGLITK
jgi:hypothetical protein